MAKKLLVIDDQTGITKVIEMIARQLGLNVQDAQQLGRRRPKPS